MTRPTPSVDVAVTSLGDVTARLQALRAAAGAPSYAEIARRVGELRSARGDALSHRAPPRATVYDCFRRGRRRYDIRLVGDIGRVLGLDDTQAAAWENACWLVQHAVEASRIVGARTTLPDPPAVFVGREHELAVLTDGRRGRARVFTISGMAGSGKTQLASAAVRQLIDRGDADGVVFAELRGFADDRPPADPMAMLAEIARQIGADPRQLPTSHAERRRTLGRWCAERRTIVVLDDAAGIDQVRGLLPPAPETIVIVTSRMSLGVRGAVNVELGPLRRDESVAFLAASTGVNEHGDHGALSRLADAAGDVPLALGVIAARILARPDWTLADHAASLAGWAHGRHLNDSIRAVLDRSHDSLRPTAQRALRLIASQPCGHLGADSVTALLGVDDDETAAILTELVDASMATRRNGGRIELHPLVRGHAADRSIDEDPSSDRDAAVAGLVDHLVGSCHAAAAAMGIVLEPRRPLPACPVPADDPLAWLDAELEILLTISGDSSRTVRPAAPIELSQALGWYLERRGRTAEGAILHARAVTAAQALGDDVSEGLAELSLGLALARAADAAAPDHFRRAERLLDGSDETAALLRAQNAQAVLAAQAGDLEAALALFRATLVTAAQSGLPRPPGVLNNIGVVLRRLGDLDGALQHHDAAYADAIDAGDQPEAAMARLNASDVHHARGDMAAALAVAEEALEIARRHGSSRDEPYALTNIGLALAGLGRVDEALDRHEEALTLARRMGSRSAEVCVLNNMADAQLEVGRSREAAESFASARWLAAEIGDQFELARACAGQERIDRDEG